MTADLAFSALHTDLYQLTMAYGYWESGLIDTESVFHMQFRTAPFNGRFSIACGLEDFLNYLNHFQFSTSDVDYLSSLRGIDNRPLFQDRFLQYLQQMRLSCDIDAVPEGTVVFPYEPLIRVQGPIIQCQLLESYLLNIINFQTLVATKAARVCLAAESSVLEFGMRRSQGGDGGVAASRAAYVGGCVGSSNVLAGKKYGIPVKGTMAHSWVMAFENEISAFTEYSRVMPNNAIFLVDTYSTLTGIQNAIRIGKELREKGYDLVGIRLDSGDLAYLSIEARRMLDEQGFENTQIIASNDLDEYVIESLKLQKARIDVWGIGTKLVTAYDQPALNGVYKLSALKPKGQPWQYKIKIAEQSTKLSIPGIHQIRRYQQNDRYIADMIYDLEGQPGSTMIDPFDITRQRSFPDNLEYEEILIPVMRSGTLVYSFPPLHEIQTKAQQDLQKFHPTILRMVNPHEYPVGLEKSLFELRTNLTLEIRQHSRFS